MKLNESVPAFSTDAGIQLGFGASWGYGMGPGEWSEWTNWTECMQCGPGLQLRFRICNSPPYCDGAPVETMHCNLRACGGMAFL